ncbi:unnamed protein product [Ceutorhynchus assimilis]|uniref:RecQ-mediated genome instability protein 1 n=1 Tax=Ceutorhynchus assimilis TaxID=467358 RepID=A0A9N9MML1_9CUCU|nr:unnamed protein product [Ceutorhynchus assimilis]
MSSELEQVKQIFVNYQIPLNMVWLESCIEWCRSDNLPANYTIKALQNMVYEQWLILDLREVEIASLPRNLSAEISYLLNGVFYVQIMQIIDISKPKLWQLQRIRNKVGKNTEVEKDFGKRVLQLTLTDGVQEVEAMEFKPCPCLSINNQPGSKLKIIGPLKVRRGRLMLEQQNVKNLGGSVDELLIKNAAENVLARALRLEENPNPHTFDEKILEVVESNNSNTQLNATITQQRNNTNVTLNQQRINTNVTLNQPTQSRTNQIPPEFEMNNDWLRELEEDFEENSITNIPSNSKTTNRTSSPDLFEEMHIDDDLLNEHLDQMDIDLSIPKSDQPSSSLPSTSSKNLRDTGQNSHRSEIITLDDSFDEIDIDSHLDNIDNEMAGMPCSTQKVVEIKNRIKSPILKQKITKPAAPKKLAQSKLTFGNLNKKGNSDEEPFSIFSKNAQKRPSSESKSPDIAGPSFKKPANLPSPETLTFKEPQHTNTSVAIPKINIMTITKLKQIIPNITKGKFKIKAKFNKVAERLQTTETSYYLAINVVDGTGDLTVELHSDVVTGFANTKPEQLAKLREMVLKNEKGASGEVLKILRTLHAKCIALDCIMELEITRGQKYPIVIKLME